MKKIKIGSSWMQIACTASAISMGVILRYGPDIVKDISLKPGENLLKEIDGDVIEIIADIDPERSGGFSFDIRGEKLNFSSRDQYFN